MSNKTQTLGYLGVLAACFALGLFLGWTPLAVRLDNSAYNLIATFTGPAQPGAPSPREAAGESPHESMVIAVDEPTLRERGGMRNIRAILTEALDKLRLAQPKVVALDVILADQADPLEDTRLETALRSTPNLILPTDLDAAGQWEDPTPRFAPLAAALGHVHSEVDRTDGVSRRLLLEYAANGTRHWALALEAFRLAHSADILESPDDLEVAGTLIPTPREPSPAAASNPGTRPMFIRYLPAGSIRTIPVLEIDQYREAIQGKTVFLGITALSAARDRLINPALENVPGVEVHAHAYETLVRGDFLSTPSNTLLFAVCLAFTLAAGLIFWRLSGWPAYSLAVLLIALSLYLPFAFFARDVVFPYFAPVAVAWLSSAGAATYQHFVVRRQLRRSESERSRYQQAMHWAAHEMRTPLTAIQGSSELMSRYNLPEEKRNQLSDMINSESKRLAKIIQTFLDVERLADGQMELKREPFDAAQLVDLCLHRVAPLAERKQIRITLETVIEATLTGDRELMEYALYNLLTNAVKYSPAETHVRVRAERHGTELRLSVEDQGIGMDDKELKSIFRKFYRTKKAEASGEAGTGIGLSIVEQIVTRHGGRIDVRSTPGRGSCFTMVLVANLPATAHAETVDR